MQLDLFSSIYDPNAICGEYLQDEKTLNGRKLFKVPHALLVEKWLPHVDYQLGIVEKGLCESCCFMIFGIDDPKKVVVQVGAARFGVNVGLCFSCIDDLMERLKFEDLTIEIPFESSSDMHLVSISIDRLETLMNRAEKIGDTEPELQVFEEDKMCLQKIIEKNGKILEQAKLEQTRPYLCKTCTKIDVKKLKTFSNEVTEWTFEAINNMRKIKHVAGFCLACTQRFNLGGGCSVFTCTSCLSSTKTCAVCMEGAAGFAHELSSCSLKMDQLLYDKENSDPLPPLQECQCPKETFLN
ncbi:MAG: hypothetical protein JSR80_01365 [Verrucomicrobia bacterium]|nr:hypothetical protein [Verrucomicrobiota bacterium]